MDKLKSLLPKNSLQEDHVDEKELQALFAPVNNPQQIEKIISILKVNPELIDGIKKFSESNPEDFAKSVGQFERNEVALEYLVKVSKGRVLGYYDFM